MSSEFPPQFDDPKYRSESPSYDWLAYEMYRTGRVDMHGKPIPPTETEMSHV